MGLTSNVRIGHKAPDFHCDAVIRGVIEEKSLSSYISSTTPQWLILLFIPAAFSFVCPTEVLAFQNCLEEFHDRNCEIVFVSVDSKHSLWHWQNVPRQYGGLGQIDIALLSDANHKMSKDYGVLIEEEGVCLRGMFILDDNGVVQQITLNNLTVGGSVLEALRLLEAFQAVAKHGVLCPIDWRPSANTPENVKTTSNTLTGSYEERLANLRKEFGDMPLTDLDAKHRNEARNTDENFHVSGSGIKFENRVEKTVISSAGAGGAVSEDDEQTLSGKEGEGSSIPCPVTSSINIPNDGLPQKPGANTLSNPVSVGVTALSTPLPISAPLIVMSKKPLLSNPERFSRELHNTAAPHPSSFLHKNATHSSSRGTKIILEFADPTSSPGASPSGTPLSHPGLPNPPRARHLAQASSSHYPHSSILSPDSPYLSYSGTQLKVGAGDVSPMPPVGMPKRIASPRGNTRMQATFEAIKKISSGLGSPRIEFPSKKAVGAKAQGEGEEMQEGEWGYFNVAPGAMEP